MTTTRGPAPYRVRSIRPRDRAGLTQFYDALSPDSRAARFHCASPSIAESTARFFCGPDHLHREGIVAERFEANGDPVIIGHVCIEPLDDDVAEMAIAVADPWQGHGVGRAALTAAIAWAQRHGIGRLVASMHCGNAGMVALMRSTGYPISYGPPGGGTVDVYLDVRRVRPLAA